MAHIIDDFTEKDITNLLSLYKKGDYHLRNKILSFLLACTAGISNIEQDNGFQEFLIAGFEHTIENLRAQL